MNQSESITAIAKALSGFQSADLGAKKNAKNPHLGNKYADLSSIWDAIREPLAANGLAVVQLPLPGERGELRLRTQLMHESGEWLASEIAMPLGKMDPQGYGSALTYARRYALAAMLGVTQEDDDAASAVRPGGHSAPAQPPRRRDDREPEEDPQGWAPSQAQIKRAYAVGKFAGLDSNEVDAVARKYAKADGVSRLPSKEAYDEFTRDDGTLQQAGARKKAWAAKQGAIEPEAPVMPIEEDEAV